jgi:hypothetical protein
MVSRNVGTYWSSESRNAIHSPVASRMPMLRDSASPRFSGFSMYRMRGSGCFRYSSTTSWTLSGDASLMMSSSKFSSVWLVTLRIARVMVSAVLYAGMITVVLVLTDPPVVWVTC